MITPSQLQQLITFEQQVRIFHWQSRSFAEHKALGELYDGFGGLLDQFIETLLGREATRLQFGALAFTLDQYDGKRAAGVVDVYLINFASFLETELEQYLPARSTELLNIRDEMLALVNRTLYLLSLS